VDAADLPRPVIWRLYLGIVAALLAYSALSTLRGGGWPPSAEAGLRRAHGQLAAWCCLMVLLAPLVWTHYFVLLFWPLAYIADRVERALRERGRANAFDWVAIGGWLLAIGLLASPAARAAGAPLAAAAILWASGLHVGVERRGSKRDTGSGIGPSGGGVRA
jgi:hypothetical protein